MTSARAAQLVMRTALALGISLASILVIANAFDLGRTRQIVEKAGWPALLAAAALLSLDVVVRSWRWRALLRPLRRLRRNATLPHLLLGYLASNALPARLGELVRCHTLGDREGLSRAAVAGTVVVERLMDVGVLALISVVAVLITPSSGPLQIAVGSAMAVSVIGALFVWRVVASPSTGVGRFADRAGLRFLASVATRMRAGVSVASSGHVVSRGVLWSVVAWGLTSVAFATTAWFVGLELSPAQVVLFVAGVNLATVVPAGPAYLGTYELAAVSVAAAIGVSPTQALAMAVMVHVATVGVTSLGGMASAWYLYVGRVAPRMPVPAMVESTEPRET